MSKYVCPKCGEEDWIVVKATVDHAIGKVAELETESGMFEFDKIGWDSKSQTRCEHCGYVGTAGDFEVADPPRGWDIFESDRGFQIQRDDEANVFASDEDALDYVCLNPDQAREAIQELLALLNDKTRRSTPVERARKIAKKLVKEMDWEEFRLRDLEDEVPRS